MTPATYRSPPLTHGSLEDPREYINPDPAARRTRRTRGVLTGRRGWKKKIFRVTQILTHAFSYAFVNGYLCVPGRREDDGPRGSCTGSPCPTLPALPPPIPPPRGRERISLTRFPLSSVRRPYSSAPARTGHGWANGS